MSIMGFDKAAPVVVLYAGNTICGYDGIGRHAGFRFLCASVGVQVPIPVPELETGIDTMRICSGFQLFMVKK